MKKKVLFACGIGFVFAIALTISLVLLYRQSEKKSKIVLPNWYDFETSSEVIEVPASKIDYSLATPIPLSAVFKTKSKTFENTLRDSSVFIEEKDVYIEDVVQKGDLLFKNNSYYFLYRESNEFVLQNMVCWLKSPDFSLIIPFPRSCEVFFERESSTEQWIATFFETSDFTEIKSFYSRFEKNVRMEEEAQKIIISAPDYSSKEQVDVILNLKEKSLVLMSQSKEVIYSYGE